MSNRLAEGLHIAIGELPDLSDESLVEAVVRPDILGRGTCAHDAIGTRRICTRFFALAASSYHCLTRYCFWSHAGHVLVSYAPVPSASPDGELK